MRYRSWLLRKLNNSSPSDLMGDADIKKNITKEISCVISFYRRTHLLRNILSSLCEQDYSKHKFEVILVEDRSGTREGMEVAEEFSALLDIKYIALEENYGLMGYSRNTGVENSAGGYILFLDDDTVILQNDFLSVLVKEFTSSGADVVLPRGNASFCILSTKYQYHDPYFPTNRCVAYTRQTLEELGGFVSTIVGQEDVEFTVRFILSGKSMRESRNLVYFHPPLIVNDSKKASAVGFSFAGLRKRYPFLIWLMLIANGLRYLPFFILFFDERSLNQARFSLGFLKGFIYYFIGRDVKYGEN